AVLETRNTGKPIQETRVVDVLSGAECLEYYAGLAAGLAGEHIDLGPRAFGYTRREPLGVVGGIGAWSYPLRIACRHVAPARRRVAEAGDPRARRQVPAHRVRGCETG